MNWWHYLLLVNLYLTLFYGFYVLLLKRETFFQLNRLYLVASALLAFVIPLMQADWVQNLFITREVQYTIYSSPIIVRQIKPEATHFDIYQLLMYVYFIGIGIQFASLMFQLVSLKRMMGKPPHSNAFSFFKKIRLDKNLPERDIILAHEQVHVRQWHSADVLLMELVSIINWFNPVAYLYRSAIKHIHEFIADHQALESGTTKADYALLLLSQTLNTPSHQLVNPFFNNSLLKQRIMMLQKNRSPRVALIKYGFSAPLFMLMLILSSATVGNTAPSKIFSHSGKNIISAATDSDKVFTAVEKTPEFPGGLNAFYTFLGRNIHYPATMREHHVQGRVFLSFIVEKDGSLSNIRSIKDIGYGSAEESIRVLKLSPKWTPGYQNGIPVRVQYNVPISYTLADDGPKPLYVVDGKITSSISNIDPKGIKSMNVLKGDQAINKYGSKGANGVVEITTKASH